MTGWGQERSRPRLKEYRPFREARAFVHKLRLNSSTEWLAFCKGADAAAWTITCGYSSNPDKTYANKGWKGMRDWLGTGTVNASLKKFLPFREARAFVRLLDLSSSKEWSGFCKAGLLPHEIPKNPHRIYAAKGWEGWRDWLGTGRDAVAKREGGL